MPSSFVSDAEQVADDIAEWVAEIVDDIVKHLSPDGRPFGEAKKTKAMQLEEYLELRGDPAKWLIFLDTHAQRIIERVSAEGVSPEIVASLHPYDIAVSYAINYSAEMEQEYRRRGGYVHDAVTVAEMAEEPVSGY